MLRNIDIDLYFEKVNSLTKMALYDCRIIMKWLIFDVQYPRFWKNIYIQDNITIQIYTNIYTNIYIYKYIYSEQYFIIYEI